jgi:hypothetical protein
MTTLFFLRWAARVILLVYAVFWVVSCVLEGRALGSMSFMTTVLPALIAVILLIVSWFFELAGGILLLIAACVGLWCYRLLPSPLASSATVYLLLILIAPLVISAVLLLLRCAAAWPKRKA